MLPPQPYTQCQSCSMPLEEGKLAGTERDGTKSITYCALCYQNGEFVNPDMTLAEMRKIVDTALKEKGWIAPMRWFAKLQLPRLLRWRDAV